MERVLSRETDRIYAFGWLCGLQSGGHLLSIYEKNIWVIRIIIVFLLFNGLYNYVCVHTHAHVRVYVKFVLLYSTL